MVKLSRSVLSRPVLRRSVCSHPIQDLDQLDLPDKKWATSENDPNYPRFTPTPEIHGPLLTTLQFWRRLIECCIDILCTYIVTDLKLLMALTVTELKCGIVTMLLSLR